MTAPWFLFIRHGETDWNREGRLQGQQDLPLNPLGCRQATEAGRRAARFLRARGHDLAATAWVVSPLARTRDTAERARVAMGLPAEPYGLDERLREFSFGSWEGLTWHDVRQAAPAMLKERRRDKWNFVPPGGGESYAMLAERVRPWLSALEGGTVAVSHGGVARVLMMLAGGLSPMSAPNVEIPQGRVLLFEAGRHNWV